MRHSTKSPTVAERAIAAAAQRGQKVIAGAEAKKVAQYGMESHSLKGYERLDARDHHGKGTVRQTLGRDYVPTLLHDAAEAYVGDVSKPLKTLIQREYIALEQRILTAIFLKFGVPTLFAKKLPMVVKRADRTMLAWEQRDLMPAMPWREAVDEVDLAVQLDTLPVLVPMSAQEARRRFLARFVELTT